MSVPFIGHHDGHVSNCIGRSWRSLGGDLHNTQVYVGGWQAPISHLSATMELAPYGMFMSDYNYGLLYAVISTVPPRLISKLI